MFPSPPWLLQPIQTLKLDKSLKNKDPSHLAPILINWDLFYNPVLILITWSLLYSATSTLSTVVMVMVMIILYCSYWDESFFFWFRTTLMIQCHKIFYPQLLAQYNSIWPFSQYKTWKLIFFDFLKIFAFIVVLSQNWEYMVFHSICTHLFSYNRFSYLCISHRIFSTCNSHFRINNSEQNTKR